MSFLITVNFVSIKVRFAYVEVSQPEVLVSLLVPFCRFSLALSNLSLFALE